MSNIDKCCANCVYFNVGWCDLYGIVPYPPDKIDCGNFAPKTNKISCVADVPINPTDNNVGSIKE